MLKDGCEAGCMHFTGGEIKHHKDCQFYKDSLSEELDNLRQQINLSLGGVNKRTCLNCMHKYTFKGIINKHEREMCLLDKRSITDVKNYKCDYWRQ